LLLELQQVGGGVEEGMNGRTWKRGWGATLPGDKKQLYDNVSSSNTTTSENSY